LIAWNSDIIDNAVKQWRKCLRPCVTENCGHMSSSVRLSICRLSVTFVHLLRRLKFSGIFLRHLIRWSSDDIQVKFYGDRPRGTPSSGELNTRGVTKYSDFGPFRGNISETVQYMLSLLLMTNRKSHMSFRLVLNSMTLDDLERCNSPNICVTA